ncbi:hypothetical protein B566_EDAN017331 [Ephemera danica]|nr:hypothetical protein B566_EDAN017331 [Ephemera danica]
MKYTILVLLFYCSLQVQSRLCFKVAAENSTLDVSDQYQPDLETDRKNCAENEHRLHEQYWAHLSTLDLALNTIDISLPVFEKRIMELEKEVVKSRKLQNSLQIKLNLVLLYQNTTRNAEDLQRKLASTNSSLSNLMEEYAILKKRNSGLAELNTYITRANGFNRKENPTLSLKIKEINQNITLKTEEIYKLLQRNSGLAELNTYITRANGFNREENPTLSLKIKEINQNITLKTEEIYKLLQNNSNLILSNQNTAKNAEDLQQKVTSMNFSTSIVMNEIAKLKEQFQNKNVVKLIELKDRNSTL